AREPEHADAGRIEAPCVGDPRRLVAVVEPLEAKPALGLERNPPGRRLGGARLPLERSADVTLLARAQGRHPIRARDAELHGITPKGLPRGLERLRTMPERARLLRDLDERLRRIVLCQPWRDPAQPRDDPPRPPPLL